MTQIAGTSQDPLYLEYIGLKDANHLYLLSEEEQGKGKIVSEKEANQILAQVGLQTTAGVIAAKDGFALTGQNMSVATNFSVPPVLPMIKGPVMPLQQLGQKVSWLAKTAAAWGACVAWAALSALANSAMRDVKDARAIKAALQFQKVKAKMQEIQSNVRRIEAERKAARRSFWGAVAAGAASGGLSFLAIKGASTPAMQKLQGVITMVSYSIGGIIQAGVQWRSKVKGPQRDADEEQIKAMRWQQEQELLDQLIEEARSRKDEAKEIFRLAIKQMEEYRSRDTQIIQATASITRA